MSVYFNLFYRKSKESYKRTDELSDKLEELTSSYDDELNDAISAIETPSIEEVEYSETELKNHQGLPSISNEDILVLDKELIGTCDDEAVEFFIQYKLKKGVRYFVLFIK